MPNDERGELMPDDIKTAREILYDWCSNRGQRFRMRVPVQADDSDMVMSRVIDFAERCSVLACVEEIRRPPITDEELEHWAIKRRMAEELLSCPHVSAGGDEPARGIVSWLRAQANSEKDPETKSAFVESHDAALGIIRGEKAASDCEGEECVGCEVHDYDVRDSEAAPKDCGTCEERGVVATPRNDMDGWVVKAACPECNAPEDGEVREVEYWRARALTAEARLQSSVKILSKIAGYLKPENIRAPDGKTYEFDPPSYATIREYWDGLSKAIRAACSWGGSDG